MSDLIEEAEQPSAAAITINEEPEEEAQDDFSEEELIAPPAALPFPALPPCSPFQPTSTPSLPVQRGPVPDTELLGEDPGADDSDDSSEPKGPMNTGIKIGKTHLSGIHF